MIFNQVVNDGVIKDQSYQKPLSFKRKIFLIFCALIIAVESYSVALNIFTGFGNNPGVLARRVLTFVYYVFFLQPLLSAPLLTSMIVFYLFKRQQKFVPSGSLSKEQFILYNLVFLGLQTILGNLLYMLFYAAGLITDNLIITILLYYYVPSHILAAALNLVVYFLFFAFLSKKLPPGLVKFRIGVLMVVSFFIIIKVFFPLLASKI